MPRLKRYAYSMGHEVATLGNIGQMTPFLIQEVAPGDTWSGSSQMLMRFSPPKRAMLQKFFVDQFIFYVPHRLVYADFENFIAEGPVDSPSYSMPTVAVGSSNQNYKSIFWRNNGVSNTTYNAIRLYCINLIWNEFFRDSDTQAVRSPTDTPGVHGILCNYKKDYWTVLNDSLGFDQDEQFFSTNVGSGTQASAQDVLDAIARQKIQLKRATYGSRYIDILRSFGINVNYQMLQRPEVVAISRSVASATDVVNTSNTNLGSLGGHLISAGNIRLRRKTFPEHGTLMGIVLVRPRQVDAAMCDWFDRGRSYDSYYDPGLVTLPHVEVQQQDIQPSCDTGVRSTSIGYQPWGDWYRKAQSKVHNDLQDGFWVYPTGVSYSAAADTEDYTRMPAAQDSYFDDVTYQHWQAGWQHRLRALRAVPRANISTTTNVNMAG